MNKYLISILEFTNSIPLIGFLVPFLIFLAMSMMFSKKFKILWVLAVAILCEAWLFELELPKHTCFVMTDPSVSKSSLYFKKMQLKGFQDQLARSEQELEIMIKMKASNPEKLAASVAEQRKRFKILTEYLHGSEKIFEAQEFIVVDNTKSSNITYSETDELNFSKTITIDDNDFHVVSCSDKMLKKAELYESATLVKEIK